jgi:hypothetical protein
VDSTLPYTVELINVVSNDVTTAGTVEVVANTTVIKAAKGETTVIK